MRIHIGKKVAKLSLFTDGMILHIDNSTDVTIKLLELISEDGKVAGHKTNMQKSIILLYIKGKISEKLRKQSHLPSHQKTNKQTKKKLINLSKKIKDLCSENYDTDKRN